MQSIAATLLYLILRLSFRPPVPLLNLQTVQINIVHGPNVKGSHRKLGFEFLFGCTAHADPTCAAEKMADPPETKLVRSKGASMPKGQILRWRVDPHLPILAVSVLLRWGNVFHHYSNYGLVVTYPSTPATIVCDNIRFLQGRVLDGPSNSTAMAITTQKSVFPHSYAHGAKVCLLALGLICIL